MLLALTVVVSACSTGIGRCDGERSVPARLADGAPAQLSDIAFEGVEAPVIATEIRTARAAPSPCASESVVVDRVGVTGASRTSISRRERELHACDWTPSSAWCGNAFDRLRDARRIGARLSITCRAHDDEPLAFVWITPGNRTAYLVVTGHGYAESYPVVRGAPVRVTTCQVELTTSSATVNVSEHTAEGRLLRTRRIEAQVSG